MALSSSPKSNSSASKAPKPTYRRASSAGQARPSAKSGAAKPSLKPSKKPFSKKPTASAKQRGTAKAAGSSRPVATPKRAGASKVSPQVQASKPKRPVASKPAQASKLKQPATPKAGRSPLQAGGSTVSQKSTLRAAQVPHKVAKRRRSIKIPGFLKPIASVFSAVGRAIASVFSRIPLPHVSRGLVFGLLGGSLLAILAAFVIANSPIFAATDIQLKGSAHVEQETVSALAEVPDGTTLLNVNESAILESLKASPWVAGVDIQREWPHTLVITPVEHKVQAIAYITADEIAWGISEDGTWIAPLSLAIAVDADGNEVALNDDGSAPEGATQLSPSDAALRLAQEAGALILTDVPSDVNPKSGETVNYEVVLAGLAYAKGFSPEFVAQIKSLSVSSVESIAANLTSGVEVSLGEPENIVEKERVVTKLLEEREGVTYINVREPGAYTFRAAPQ
ncbi:cell division protein FtsQ/DivIB [Collinsella provencensis]|uniref:cell division protein FtsQ/DivIB n=1 Tax=Collinsella provencensis TaxID=1937461 RepID=UPI000C858B8F|nr:FtsQ-type POTRA domain-containing protein [Collinsella provencensis]